MPFDFSPPETQPDVFSLEGLIAWLEQQPGETEYEYVDSKDCVLCRYFRAHDFTVTDLGLERFFTGDGQVRYSSLLDEAAVRGDTYATALTRARELIAERV